MDSNSSKPLRMSRPWISLNEGRDRVMTVKLLSRPKILLGPASSIPLLTTALPVAIATSYSTFLKPAQMPSTQLSRTMLARG